MNRWVYRWSFVAFLVVMESGCATLRSGPGFSHQGVEVKCLRDIPEQHVSVVSDSAKLGIDVLRDDVFKARALSALRDADTHASCKNEPTLNTLTAEQLFAHFQAAASRGFSISTRNSCWPWSRTTAWEGSDEPECGRVVALNRRKLGSREPALWAGTIIHEVTHVADFGHHGTNERGGNECTIPNVLGDLAEWRAWELQQAARGTKQPYTTQQTVCASVAALCRQSGPEYPCVVDEDLGEIKNQKPLCQ